MYRSISVWALFPQPRFLLHILHNLPEPNTVPHHTKLPTRPQSPPYSRKDCANSPTSQTLPIAAPNTQLLINYLATVAGSAQESQVQEMPPLLSACPQ